MFKRLVSLIILVPCAFVFLVLTIENRQIVPLTLNPFCADPARWTFQAPIFLWLLLSLIIGIILGSFSTWCAQHKHRKAAKQLRKALQKQEEATLQAQNAAQAAFLETPFDQKKTDPSV